MPAKKQKQKPPKIKQQFLDLSARIQDIYDDISLLHENLKKPRLSYGATHLKLLFLPYFSSQIRQEWAKIYQESTQKTQKLSKRLNVYTSFLTERLKELDSDIARLRNKHYYYIFN